MAVRYMTGTTAQEFTISGIVIPKRQYTAAEQQGGKQAVVEITEEQYFELSKNRVFRSLLDTGKIVIHNEVPVEAMSSQERFALERRRNAGFAQQVQAAEARAAEFERLYNDLKGQSTDTSAYSDLEAKYQELDRVASAKIEELTRKVEELEALLADTDSDTAEDE